MADVTISQLTPGTPAGSNIIPYSTGSVTLGVPVSAMFQNTGNVGINTTNVPSTLTVNGDMHLLAYGKLNFSNTAGTSYINAPQSNHLALYTAGESRIRIDSIGNVGIGTVTPVSKLHVDGTITANTMSCSAIDSASQSWQVADDQISIFANTNFKVDVGTYDVHFRANVNACGGPYTDNYYGKIYIGIGYDYSSGVNAAVRYIGWQQISVSPRTFCDSGGGVLTAAAVMYNPATGTEYTKIVSNSGLMDNLRIKFKVSGFVWNNVNCFPPYTATNSGAVIKIRKVL